MAQGFVCKLKQIGITGKKFDYHNGHFEQKKTTCCAKWSNLSLSIC